MSNRDPLFDALKGLGILLVLLGHCIQWDTWLWRVIYSFHMPLFFIVSGCFFGRTLQRDGRTFARSLLRNLLVPYLLFMILAVLSHVILDAQYFAKHSWTSIAVSCVNGVPFLNGPLWFLHSLMVAQCFLWCTLRLMRREWRMLILPTLLVIVAASWYLPSVIKSILPMNMFRCLWAAFFVGCGFFGRQIIEQFAEWSNQFVVRGLLVSGVCMFVLGMSAVWFSLDMTSALLTERILLVVTATAGVVVLVPVAHVILRLGDSWLVQAILFLGTNSLYYFGLEKVLQPFVSRSFVGDWGRGAAFSSLLIVLSLFVPVAKIANEWLKTRLIPFSATERRQRSGFDIIRR